MKKIKYFFPDFIKNFYIYEKIFELKKIYPYIFYDNVEINTIFGNISNITWNGGSIDLQTPRISREMLISLLNNYRKMNINIQFTMTNPLLEKIDLYDRVGNELLSLLAEKFSDSVEILVSADILKEHILLNYPELKIAKSIISTKNDLDFNNLNEYNHVVLPIRYNKNFNKLKEIPKQDRDKYEFLCTDPCPDNCPRLYEHYNGFAEVTLFKNNKENIDCLNNKIQSFKKSNHSISYEDIIKDYIPLGFNNFKISGRGVDKIKVILSIVPFLIKQEYQMEVIDILFYA